MHHLWCAWKVREGAVWVLVKSYPSPPLSLGITKVTLGVLALRVSFALLAQVCFERPVVPTAVLLFLASDGTISSNQHKPRVTVQLGDVDGLNHSLGEHPVCCATCP